MYKDKETRQLYLVASVQFFNYGDVNLQISIIFILITGKVSKVTNQSVACINQTANQKPGNFAHNHRENSHWSEPNRDIQKRGLSRTSKAPLVDIEINRTGLQKFPAQRSNFSVN